jgi:glycosyltransferase involved in cell wall biosynthesis
MNSVAATQLVAEVAAPAEPFLTIAVPQHNRRRHLEAVLESVAAQTFRDVEIVVSDDASSDDSAGVLPETLRRLGLPFRYYLHPHNVGYDRNVRFSLDAARGRYVMLLANDDELAAPDVLERIHEALATLGYPEVATTNYRDLRTEQTHRRALVTAIAGSGVDAAVSNYRAFSFVSGLLYDRRAVQRERDEMTAGETVFYQVLVACKILAAGGQLATLAVDAVNASISVDGERGRNWADILRNEPRSFESRDNLSGWLLLAVQRGVLPVISPGEQSSIVRKILIESYAFSYPLGLVEARRQIRWSFAVGYARGLWPASVFRNFVEVPRLRLVDKVRIWFVYAALTAAGLLLPVRALLRARPAAATAVRRVKLRGAPRPS